MQLCRGEAARSEMRVRHRKEGERTQWPPTRYVPLLSVRECQGQPHSEPTVATVLDYVSLPDIVASGRATCVDRFLPIFLFYFIFLSSKFRRNHDVSVPNRDRFPFEGKKKKNSLDFSPISEEQRSRVFL